MPKLFADPAHCVEEILQRVGRKLVVGAPLGLGKPNHLINALYRRARDDRRIELHLLTALSLERPRGGSDLERRLLEPFVHRHFGAGYPDLDYLADLRARRVPDNVQIAEFYFAPGQCLDLEQAQQDYTSINYTHVGREMLRRGANVIAQLISRGRDGARAGFSLSSNPDVTLEVVPQMRRGAAPCAVVGQVHPRLPFMARDAFVAEEYFDLVLEAPELDFELFGLPAQPVSLADHWIGLHASLLIRDGGTLQIGIGSLSDAIVHWTVQRHERNADYRALLAGFGLERRYGGLIADWGGVEPFRAGLYGASEMVMDGLLHLYDRGILSRRVYDWAALQRLTRAGQAVEEPSGELLEALLASGAIDDPLSPLDVQRLRDYGVFDRRVRLEGDELRDPQGRALPASLSSAESCAAIIQRCLGQRLRLGTVLHGAFFLGSRRFYRRLAELDDEAREAICMTSVERVNQLYGSERLDRLQRESARFFNTVMKMSLLGAATADGLEDGRVVSGIGGQYNFVAMAHALADGRSILMLRSTRGGGRKPESNIVWRYGHTSIPRHLRDIVITEYGIADLRGRSDSECIAALLEISDARFQQGLLREARRAGKLRRDYRLPDHVRDNLPERIAEQSRRFESQLWPTFPLGCDFTAEERVLIDALTALKRRNAHWSGRLRTAAGLLRLRRTPAEASAYLERMSLSRPGSLRERLYRRLVVGALYAAGAID